MGSQCSRPSKPTSTHGLSARDGSHQQSVPVPEEFDAPPSYEDAQHHTSPPAPSVPSSANFQPSDSPRSAASSITGEDTPLRYRTGGQEPTAPSSAEAYRSPQPMSTSPNPLAARREKLEGQPGCCFSSTGGCCFSDYGGCCFSSNGACCFSNNEACCFSDHGACCFSDNGGCCCNGCAGSEK